MRASSSSWSPIPEIADISPLTDRSLSILGHKSGTTRVSAYAEGKKLVGVFDVEVTYDTSLLQATLNRRFPHAEDPGDLGQRPHHAVGRRRRTRRRSTRR